MSSSEVIVTETANRRGWSDATIISLLCQYIDKNEDPEHFQRYLDSIMDEEDETNSRQHSV